MMNIYDFFHEFTGLSKVNGPNTLRYFLWYDKDYALDWGWMAPADNPNYIFTHVTSQKTPPIEFPKAIYRGCFYDSAMTVYKNKGLMGKYGYCTTTSPSQDFWDKYGK